MASRFRRTVFVRLVELDFLAESRYRFSEIIGCAPCAVVPSHSTGDAPTPFIGKRRGTFRESASQCNLSEMKAKCFGRDQTLPMFEKEHWRRKGKKLSLQFAFSSL